MLRITIEDGGLMQRLTAMIAKAENISREFWDDISTKFIESIHMGFEVGGIPPWLPTKSGKRPLIGRGILMNSVQISSQGPTFIEWEMGAGLPYARIQQEGGTIHHPGSDKLQVFPIAGKLVFTQHTRAHEITIPTRRYFRIYDDMEQYIVGALHDYLLMDNTRFPTTIGEGY